MARSRRRSNGVNPAPVSTPTTTTRPSSSSRFQPSQAYLDKSNSMTSTTSTSTSIPVDSSIKPHSNASWLLEEEDDEALVPMPVVSHEVDSFLQSILRRDAPPPLLQEEPAQPKIRVMSVCDTILAELEGDDEPVLPESSILTNVQPVEDVDALDFGITRKHPRASTSRSQVEFQNEEDLSARQNPLSLSESLDPDQSYDSDQESLQSEGLIQEQLVGSRSHDMYNQEMDVALDDQMDYAEDLERGNLQDPYGMDIYDDEDLKRIDDSYSILHVKEEENSDDDDSLLVTREGELSHKRSRQDSSYDSDDGEEDDYDQEEEEGEIREDPSELAQINQFVSQPSSTGVNASVVTSSNARYPKSRRLESQDSVFGSRTDFIPSYSSYSTHSTQSPTISNAEISRADESSYPSSVDSVLKPLEKASYTRRPELMPSPAVATTFAPSPVQPAATEEDPDYTASSGIKAAYTRPAGTLSATTAQIPPPLKQKSIIKEELPMSQSDRFKSLPLKLHQAFPDLLTLEQASSPHIFTQPFRSADAPSYIPDETVLHGYWPAPPTLKAGKGIFPPPSLTPSQLAAVEEDKRGRVDVFIDNSNVLYSFLNWVRNRPESRISITSSGGGNHRVKTAKTVTLQGKKVKMDYKILLGILERGRKVEKRVLVGSSPLWQSLETATKWGYEVSLLQRVARPIAPPPLPIRPVPLRTHLSSTLSDSVVRPRITPNAKAISGTLISPQITSTTIASTSTALVEATSATTSIDRVTNLLPASPITSNAEVPVVELKEVEVMAPVSIEGKEEIVPTSPPLLSSLLSETPSATLESSELEPSISTTVDPLPPSLPLPLPHPHVSRFTAKGEAPVLPDPVLDPITGLLTIPAVIVPRKRTRGIKKSKAAKMALAAAAAALAEGGERIETVKPGPGLGASAATGVNAIRGVNKSHGGQGGDVRRDVGRGGKGGGGGGGGGNGRTLDGNPNRMPQQAPSLPHHQLQLHLQSQRPQPHQLKAQSLQLQPQQLQQQHQSPVSGLIVQKQFKEQAVDEVLHLKILESLLDYTPSPDLPRPLLVVATGDANSSEYNPTGFLGCVRKALERGWDVEIVAFREGTSSSWLGEEMKANEMLQREEGVGEKSVGAIGRGRLRVVDLERFANELVTI